MNNNFLNIRKAIPAVIHICICIIVLVVPAFIMLNAGVDQHMYVGYLIRTGTLIVLFYINYFLLIDRFLFRKQFLTYILVNIILMVCIVYIKDLIFESMLFFDTKPKNKMNEAMPRPPEGIRILGDYLFFVLAVGMSVALKATRRWYTDSINLEIVKNSQLEADLKNLRSQLNPHFLFNTLNNIYSLIAIDTTKAQESVHRLSSLLRYILYENEQKFVPIEKELEFTQNYIDLMKLRIASNVKLDVLIKNNSKDKKIITLLFITLIENAFKHGINNGKDSFIDIKIFIDDDGVLCTVENSLSDKSDSIEDRKSGIGLANIRKRLELLYPRKHDLQIEKRDHSFFVLLCVNFNSDRRI